MPRPQPMAPWMAYALELGFTPDRIRQKMRRLRWNEANKFGIEPNRMEVVYGWQLDEMSMSCLYAIEHERCRGPRCGRIAFRTLVPSETYLGLITGDIIDPASEPVFCLNFAWACSKDNSGDRDRGLQDRAARLVAQRLIAIQPIDIPQISIPVQRSIFDELGGG